MVSLNAERHGRRRTVKVAGASKATHVRGLQLRSHSTSAFGASSAALADHASHKLSTRPRARVHFRASAASCGESRQSRSLSTHIPLHRRYTEITSTMRLTDVRTLSGSYTYKLHVAASTVP